MCGDNLFGGVVNVMVGDFTGMDEFKGAQSECLLLIDLKVRLF